MTDVIKKVFPFIWVAGWITFFVWLAGPYLPRLPVWFQVGTIVVLIIGSTVWLFNATAESEEGE